MRFIVENLVWDEEIDAHFAKHSVAMEDVLAVLMSDFLGFENLPDRGGTHVMIGPDPSDRILLVSIQADVDAQSMGASHRLGEPPCPASMGKGKRWRGMTESRQEARRKAEALKDTEQELEGLTPVKMTVSPNLGIVYSLRFSADEMGDLREAAQVRGIKLSELIREAALNAAAEAQDKPTPRDAALKEARELVGAAARALDKIAKP